MAKNSNNRNSVRSSFDSFLLRANDKAKKSRCLDVQYRQDDGYCGASELLENEKTSQKQEQRKRETV